MRSMRTAVPLATRGFAARAASEVRPNVFKAAILKGDHQIGLWTGLSSTLVAEMLSHVSGFDWFVIDMEHSPNELQEVLVSRVAAEAKANSLRRSSLIVLAFTYALKFLKVHMVSSL